MAGLSPNSFSGPYIANGVQRAFPFTFTALNDFDVTVRVDGAVANRALYVVTVVENGGTVTFNSPPAAGQSILAHSEPDFAQLSEFANQGAYNLDTVNKINRRASVRDLYLLDGLKRSLRVPVGDYAPPLSSPRLNPNRALGTDAGGALGWVRLEQTPAIPQRVEFEASVGQTRFPASGDFSDLDPPFIYVGRPLVVEVNGITVPSEDYNAPGGVEPIIFSTPMLGGETVTFYSFKLDGGELTDVSAKNLRFSIGKSVHQKLTEGISLDDGRSANDDDDNIILAEKMDDGYRTIRMLANKGSADGVYRLWTAPWINAQPDDGFDDLVSSPGNLMPGTRLIGDGQARTIVETLGKGYAFMFNSRSGDPEDNARDLLFQDLTIRGVSETQGFLEPEHLVALAGVTNPNFIRVAFEGFRGDGCYLTHGFKPDDVALNFAATFFDCLFDGKGRANRNAISAESIDGLRVLYSRFVDCTQSGMPGPIDLEPLNNTDVDQARALEIIGNVFDGYNGAAVTLNMGDPERYALPPSARILHNTMRNGTLGLDIYGGMNATALAAVGRTMGVTVAHNRIENVSKPLRFRGAHGVTVVHNEFEDVDAILLGNLEGLGNRKVIIDHNSFTRSGLTTGATLLHDDSSIDCSFSDNMLDDSGLRTGQTSIAILGRDGNVGLRVNRNRVSDPNSRLLAFAIMGSGIDTISPRSQKVGNELPFGALPVADNFNPPRPALGLSANLEITGGGPATIAPGGKYAFDTTLAGATLGKKFNASIQLYLNNLSPGGRPIIGVSVTQVNVVSCAIFNAGTANLTLPSGTIIKIEEI